MALGPSSETLAGFCFFWEGSEGLSCCLCGGEHQEERLHFDAVFGLLMEARQMLLGSNPDLVKGAWRPPGKYLRKEGSRELSFP